MFCRHVSAAALVALGTLIGCDGSSSNSPSGPGGSAGQQNQPANTGPRLELTAYDDTGDYLEWTLACSGAGSITVRLLVISEGESKTAAISELASQDPIAEKASVTVKLQKKPNAASGDEAAMPLLWVHSEGLDQKHGERDDFVKLPEGLVKGSKVISAIADSNSDFDARRPVFLYKAVSVPKDGEVTMSDDLDELIALSKKGAAIVAVVLEWKPK